ncbi:MAG: hypothetical protein ACRDMH_15225, partial [Solirubrobacterales bacterium]
RHRCFATLLVLDDPHRLDHVGVLLPDLHPRLDQDALSVMDPLRVAVLEVESNVTRLGRAEPRLARVGDPR